MATASHGHIPDLSATLNDRSSCAPLSDLWNLPQSKLFPAQSTPASGTSSVAPSAPGSVPATPPAAAAPSTGQQPASYFGSLWAPAPQAGTPAAAAAAPPAPPAAAPAAGGSSVANVGLMASGSATGSLLSPSYRTGVTRGIWGPRDEGFGFRQPSTGAATPTAPGPSPTPLGNTMPSGASLIANQPQPQPAYAHGPAGPAGPPRNYLGGWLDTSPGAVGNSTAPSPPGAAGAASAGLGLHAATPVGSAGPVTSVGGQGSVVAPVGSPISAAGAQGMPTTPARFSTPTGSKGLAVGAHTSPHSGVLPVGATASSASSTSSMSSTSSVGPATNRPQKKSGRPSTNTELYKTELCASYMSTGGNCPYGEKCQFAHGTQELKTVDRPPKWRSKPCQNWVKTGSCSYNERCCFRHDVPVCPQ